MTGTDAADLSAVHLDYDLFYESGLGLDGPTVERVAAWLLASDWLAGREAAARAEALREAAEEWGGTEQVRLETVGKWLRARAARLAE